MIPEDEEVHPSMVTFNGYDSKKILFASDMNHGVI